jgi:lipopolysaccharide export system protein LptA
MRNTPHFFSFTSYIFFSLLCITLNAQETNPDTSKVTLQAAHTLLDEIKQYSEKERFSIDGDSLHIEDQIIFLKGNASIKNRDTHLQAAHIVYHRSRDLVEASAVKDSTNTYIGKPQLKRGQETLQGQRIRYNLEKERGTIYDGRIRRKRAYYAGQQIQVRSQEEFHVHQGSYTTCDKDHPHFDFYSPRIKVLSDEMAIARPVYFRVKERRLFWIPFYVFSLREDRQSGILTPSFGRRPIRFGSPESEWEARNLGYYFAPNDYWDVSLSGDFRTRSGWLARSRLRYALRDRYNGQVETSLESRQSGINASYEWRTTVRHSQTLSDGARIVANGTFQSNKDFNRDNSYDLYDRLDRTLRSNFTYNKRWRESGNSVNLKASQTKNLDTGRFTTSFPEVSLRKARKPLWGAAKRGASGKDSPWYSRVFYDASGNLRNTRRGTSTDTTTETSSDLRLNVSTQLKPLSWLQLNPQLSQTWRDRDLRNEDDLAVRNDRVSATLRLNQTYYGMFFPRIGSITAFRHALNPSVSLSYQATHSDTGGVLGYGGDGSVWKQNRPISLSIGNSFWVKIEHGEEESKIRLAQLRFSTAYNIDNKTRPFSDLNSTLNVDAGRYLDTRLTLISELYDDESKLQLLSPRLKRFEVSSTLRLSGSGSGQGNANRYGRSSTSSSTGALSSGAPYSSTGQDQSGRFGYEGGLQRDFQERSGRRRFQLSHYYSRSRSGTRTTKRSWLRSTLGLSQTRRWHIDYSLNYNLHVPGRAFFSTDRITSELLSVQREFHDWAATFNVEPSRFYRDFNFYIRVQFKDIPQIKFERGDTR